MKQYEDKAVWCKTEELANEFLSKAHEAGYKWSSGVNLLDESNWEVCESETCYYIYKNKESRYGSKGVAESKGCEIVEYKGDGKMKYKLLEKEENGLHRIQALKDFGDVKKGDIGGYVENEDNLSQEGNCWVYQEAEVFDKAKVYGNAKVYGDAQVYGDARVFDDARVYRNAVVSKNAWVFGYAVVRGNARVSGDALVFIMQDYIIKAYRGDITASFRVRAVDRDNAVFKIEKLGFTVYGVENIGGI